MTPNEHFCTVANELVSCLKELGISHASVFSNGSIYVSKTISSPSIGGKDAESTLEELQRTRKAKEALDNWSYV